MSFYILVLFDNSEVTKDFPESIGTENIRGIYTRKSVAKRDADEAVKHNECDNGLVYYFPSIVLNQRLGNSVLKDSTLVYSTDPEMYPVESVNNVVKASDHD